MLHTQHKIVPLNITLVNPSSAGPIQNKDAWTRVFIAYYMKCSYIKAYKNEKATTNKLIPKSSRLKNCT